MCCETLVYYEYHISLLEILGTIASFMRRSGL